MVVRTLAAVPEEEITGLPDSPAYSINGSCWYIFSTTNLNAWVEGLPEQPINQYTVTEAAMFGGCDECMPPTTQAPTTTVDPYTYYMLEGCPGSNYESKQMVVRTLSPVDPSEITGLPDSAAYSINGSCWFISSNSDINTWTLGLPEQPFNQYTVTETALLGGCEECLPPTTIAPTTTRDPYTYYTLVGCPGSEYAAVNMVVRTLAAVPEEEITGLPDSPAYSINGSCWYIFSTTNLNAWAEGLPEAPFNQYTVTEAAMLGGCDECLPPTTQAPTTTTDPYTYYLLTGCPGTEYEATNMVVRTSSPVDPAIIGGTTGATYSINGSCWYIADFSNLNTWTIGLPEQPLNQYTLTETHVLGCDACTGTDTTTTSTTTRFVETQSYRFMRNIIDPEVPEFISIDKTQFENFYGSVPTINTTIELGALYPGICWIDPNLISGGGDTSVGNITASDTCGDTNEFNNPTGE